MQIKPDIEKTYIVCNSSLLSPAAPRDTRDNGPPQSEAGFDLTEQAFAKQEPIAAVMHQMFRQEKNIDVVTVTLQYPCSEDAVQHVDVRA